MVVNFLRAPEGILNGQQAIKPMLCASFPIRYHNIIRNSVLGQIPGC